MASITLRAGRPSIPVRDRLAAAQAERAERLNRVEAGELVEAADVAADWADIVATTKTRLLMIPARIAARHPGHPEIIETLTAEIDSALSQLADNGL